MDLLSQPLLWCIIQVTLVAVLGWLLCTLVSRWTSPGAAIVPAVALAAIVLLTASAFVPWPTWWRFGPQWRPAPVPVRPVGANEVHAPPDWTETPLDLLELEDLASPIKRGESPQADADIKQREAAASSFTIDRFWSWLPTLIAGVLGCGAVLGLLQLAGGLLSVRNIRKASRALHDAQLLELVDCLRAELCLQQNVRLRECDHLTTAATVGWIQPVVLLPPTWREWTVDQLRAVLAHELAHVARGDFLACVLAQLSLALHFYHPLIHWLAARLRLEQELAADATAAALAGGRKIYLQSLAELALHNSERSLGWPAHTFLPTQGTFLRRIEMLRDSKHVPTLASGHGKAQRWAAVGLLIVGAMIVAGLRGGPAPSPFDTAANAQQPAAATGGEKASDVDLTYVTNDTRVLVVIRPEEFKQVPEIKKVLEETVVGGKENPFSLLKLDGLEQMTHVAVPGVGHVVLVLQFSKPTTIETIATKTGLVPADVPRVTLGAATKEQPHQSSYGVLNDRTYVFGSVDTVTKYLGNRRKGEPLIAKGAAWEKVRKGAIVAAVDMELVREQLQPRQENATKGSVASSLSAIAPLWTDSEFVVAGVALEGNTARVRAIATCQDTELAENVAETATAARTLAQNYLRAARENERDMLAIAKVGIATANELLKGVKVERNEKLVIAETSTDLLKAGSPMAENLINAISEARVAGNRTISANNLKQIMLAMHNWADAHKGRFPPPVIMGKDGKGGVPHSWRVELLPYLEQAALYEQYNFDEPWDSEANKRVLEKMPAVFRDPTDDPKSTTTAYHVLVGPKLLEETLVPGGASAPEGGFPTAFSAKNGMMFSQIIDGLSNTIATVEAKAGIPWTKPEDLVFDPTKDPPKFGGLFKEGFFVGICDGSVRFMKSDSDPATLKLMIMPGDGQPIPQP